MAEGDQYLRKATLIIGQKDGDEGLDLSEMRFRFKIQQSDYERPNTAEIRVYNLSKDTVKEITKGAKVEFTRVVLQAGYQNAAFGVIFDGTIKQYRIGRENATDTYLDILAAHGDEEYNFGVVNKTLAAGYTQNDVIKASAEAMSLKVDTKSSEGMESTGGTVPNPRGKVMFGMARAHARNAATTMGSTWSIQDRKVVVTPLQGYREGEAVVLNARSGMIGIPEQTDQGIQVRCLLNPKLKIGGLVQIDNESINKTVAQQSSALPAGQMRYDSIKGQPIFLANIADDGFYRLYVVEYIGDTRGRDWYCDLICLAVDKSSKKVLANE